MEQLTGLDTTFLNIETPTTYGHVAGLALFDPSTAPRVIPFDELKELLRQRLHLVPPYRRRLVEVPFGIDHPYWIEDPDFDLDFHVRHVGLPAPGTTRQLTELVERIVSRPLDRNRPLWELYYIEGLENGYVAQLSKTHHAAFDGVAGADLLASMLDLEPEPRMVDPPETPWRPDRVPSQLEMLRRGVTALQLKPALGYKLWVEWMESLPSLVKAAQLPPSPLGAYPAWPSLPGRKKKSERRSLTPAKPPRTSFNAPIGPHRRIAFTSVPLADIKAIKSSLGVTVNDVVLAVCAGALRQYLLDHDELPATPLVAMVPVSVRAEDRRDDLGNQVDSVTTPLFTDIEEPAERLRETHEAMLIAKESREALPAELQQDLAQYSPPAVAGVAARTMARASAERLVDLPYNIVISNVPGPQIPLYGAGSRLVAYYPISTITDGAGLNITVQSYDGNLDIGLVGCRDLVPDIADLVDHLHAAITELEEVAGTAAPAKKARTAKKTTTKKKRAPAKKKTTTKKKRAPAKKKTTTKKKRAPAKKKTTTKKN